MVKLPGEGEWRQQGAEPTRSGDKRKGPGSGFLRLGLMFVGAKLPNISLVIVICSFNFGWFIMTV